MSDQKDQDKRLGKSSIDDIITKDEREELTQILSEDLAEKTEDMFTATVYKLVELNKPQTENLSTKETDLHFEKLIKKVEEDVKKFIDAKIGRKTPGQDKHLEKSSPDDIVTDEEYGEFVQHIGNMMVGQITGVIGDMKQAMGRCLWE
ncbi:hypothetical protein [Simkania sp.]|uniref:hypothetical protein n=1 Tax=Simkania sp. TaxID=34094 RepID=UPI003B5162C5